MSHDDVITSSPFPDSAIPLSAGLSLSSFLSRPTVISTSTWTEGQAFALKLDPYSLLWANSHIANKLRTYKWFRSGLKLTVTFSASPFHYSALSVDYVPLEDAVAGGAVTSYGQPTGISLNSATVGQQADLAQRSTLSAHAVLTPQQNPTVTLTVPFIYPYDWFDLANKTSITMGTLLIHSYQNLRTAGTASTSTSTVTVSASFIDPEVAGPTVTLQSGTLTGLSHDLSKRGLDTASAWAGVAARAARLLGLTNHPSTQPSSFVSPTTFPALSNTEVSPPCEVLALGPTVSLSTAPTTGDDDLSISKICAMPFYYGNAPWTIANTVGTQLAQVNVTPDIYISSAATGYNGGTYRFITPSPGAYVGSMFRFWRGTMCFKFKVLCSQHHRGKLRIYYDTVNVGASAPAEAVIPSMIMDLASTTEATIKVPMNTYHHWLLMSGTLSNLTGGYVENYSLTSSVPATSFDRAYHNGTIKVAVFQELSCPSDTGDVSVLCECWLEGAQFADPVGTPLKSTKSFSLENVYYVQSGNEVLGDEEVMTAAVGPPSADKNRHVTEAFGEDCLSLRALLHRSVFWRSCRPNLDMTSDYTTDTNVHYERVFPRFPRGFQYCQDTFAGVVDVTQASPVPINYACNYPALMIAAMFQGFKGSMRWRVALQPGSLIRSIYLSRAPGTFCEERVSAAAVKSGSVSARNAAMFAPVDWSGGTVTSSQAPGVTADIPDYTKPKFLPTSTRPEDPYVLGIIDDEARKDCVRVGAKYLLTGETQILSDNCSFDIYLSASPDFQLCHYKMIPNLFYGTLAAASITI